MSTHHLTIDELSAYLDHELLDEQRESVERHLDDCEECLRQLHGLRSVSAGLREVERLAPPPLLEQAVRRQLRLVDRPEPVWKQSRVGGKLQSNLLLLFALVIALALMVGLFSDALQRMRAAGPGSTIVAPSGGTLVTVEDEGSGEDSSAEVVRLRAVGERLFELRAGTWRERELEDPASARWLTHQQMRTLWNRYPELLGLADLWTTSGPAAVLFQDPAAEGALGISAEEAALCMEPERP